jgi:hypothetical protein
MPNRKQGFVRRGEGVLETNRALSNIYERQANDDQIGFNEPLQKSLIDEVKVACEKQNYYLHFVSTDLTHVHVLVSWKTEQTWLKVRNGIKMSLALRLNRELNRTHCLSEGASRKRVKDQSHFDRLVRQYLPKHDGWKWQPDRGLFK